MRGRRPGPDVHERLTTVRGRVVRSLAVGDGSSRDGPLVVVVPGLGLPFYTLATARALVERGMSCTVLDLPGFGSDRLCSTPPNIHAIGLATARWVEAQASDRPVVLLGHSTGAQAALTAALALGAGRPFLSLVLAGTTFAPRQRGLIGLATATPSAYRHDRPDELDPAQLVRGGSAIVAILRSGLRDAPEDRIRHLRVPVTITAGIHDSFNPVEWLDLLATSAVLAPTVRTSLLGGSHNNLFTHPDEVADLVCLAGADAMTG